MAKESKVNRVLQYSHEKRPKTWPPREDLSVEEMPDRSGPTEERPAPDHDGPDPGVESDGEQPG